MDSVIRSVLAAQSQVREASPAHPTRPMMSSQPLPVQEQWATATADCQRLLDVLCSKQPLSISADSWNQELVEAAEVAYLLVSLLFNLATCMFQIRCDSRPDELHSGCLVVRTQ